MSYLGIVVASVFASNALLAWGLGSVPDREREASGQLASALALALVNALASSLLWAIHALVLSPLKLGSLDILFFALLALPLVKFLAKAAALSGRGLLSQLGASADDLAVGSLVFGVALLASNGGYSFPEALAASAASGLGYWMATVLLESIRERLELSDLPRPFKGAPSMLISAGLMGLALMGIDAAFVKALADEAMIWLQLAILLLAAVASSFLASLLSSAWKRRKKTEAGTLQLEAMLPGYDCGLCGRADCRSYASALDLEREDPALCGPGGSRLEARLRSHLSGRPGDTRGQALRAVVRCGGGDEAAAPAFAYDGREDCRSAAELYGGHKRCKEGCLGFGSCARVCRRGAIRMAAGLAIVSPSLCTGCGDCVEACPKHLISLLPRAQLWYVACASKRESESRKADCSAACTGCGACERASDRAEFLLEDSLARENSESTGGAWAELAAGCPSGAIVLAGSEKRRLSPFRKKAR